MIVAREEGFDPSPPPAFGGGVTDGTLQRNIPKNHDFDPKALKPMARMLFSSSVSLGHAVTAYKEFTRIKSSSISPDGMLGGRGYVLKVKDVRAKLQQACELLSSITDTIHDEMNAPYWQPKLADLGENDAEDVTEFMDEAEEVLEDPEGFGEKKLDQIEKKNDGPGGTPNKKDEASQVPEGGDIPSETKPFGKIPQKTATSKWSVNANSSLPVTTLPGPRVDHLDRGEQTGPYGSYNKGEPLTQDEWGQTEGVGDDYLYESDWANNVLDKTGKVTWGESAVPDANSEPTETEARDFGIGYGAKGRGSEGYGTVAPDGRGVFGPSSGLPNNPGAPTRDTEEGTGPYLDGIERNVWACDHACGESQLPVDGPDPIARSDYFEGNKGNQFNVNLRGESGLPGSGPQSPDAPLKPRPAHNNEHMFGGAKLEAEGPGSFVTENDLRARARQAWRPALEGESRMPGDQAPALYNYDRDVMDVGHKVERQDAPYVKYDWNTHNYRNDIQDVFRHEDENRTGSNG